MAFIESSINSPKLGLVSEPWNQDDLTFKNRATLSPYVDSLNCGFSVFLRHPSEVGKKIAVKNGQQRDLSSMPIQCRMDRIRFTIMMNAIKRLVNDKDYQGKTIKCMNFWYDDAGEVILTDGKRKPCHTATIMVGRDEKGRIVIGIKEEKHPNRDQRPGAKFIFESGMWFKNCDNATGSELSPAEDSKENALAYVQNWQDAVYKCLDHNYKIFMEEKAKRREQMQGKQQAPQTGGGAWD